MSHAEQLERETEQTRAEISSTLDELRACMTPGHVLDQMVDRVSGGTGAAFMRNLKDQTVSNPLPVTLIGAGLAWLMLGSRGTSAGGLMRGTADHLRNVAGDAADSMREATDAASRTASDKKSEWGDAASRLGKEASANLSSTAERARESATEAGSSMREAAGSVAESAQQATSDAAGAMRDTAGSMTDSVQRSAAAGYEAAADSARRTASTLSESTKAVGQRTWRTGSTFLDLCREQPLMLTGLGVAVGAMIGALLPATETEDQLMGQTSDRVKERAQDVASEQYQDVKEAGERVVEAVQDEAQQLAGKGEGGSKDEMAGHAKAHEAKLAPEQQADPEWTGQPWKAENAPL
ncbi:DUF3618 domain-containing protein [Bradyrhizobium sp. CSA112]|uniref:DUF3618 domain-containing protein n=1 Tax=Bradyrhizobium sp. CSA112 TaxID=2699170 RepID=UPI0023B1C2B0|nr:DUF3618 domain-containing protein [Bradyrhizobium sp. CSA112]MDE5454065.1 DUF3618 domain-containing protein [Bradyrhizobium sp. CSA112]